jgi:hypothetical protein
MQAVVSIGQSFDRPLDRQRSIFDIAEEADLPAPTPFRDRHGVLLLGDIKSHKDFAMLSHGPPSMHEARLGLPEQPSFLTARKGGPPAQPANMTSRASKRLANQGGTSRPNSGAKKSLFFSGTTETGAKT